MKTKTTSKRSLSALFLILVMIVLFIASYYSSNYNVDTNHIASLSAPVQDVSLTKAIHFVVEMIGYSL